MRESLAFIELIARPSMRAIALGAVGLALVASATGPISERVHSAGTSVSQARAAGAAPLLPDFIEIPEGPFLMGSDVAVDPLAFSNERWSADRAQAMVNVSAFHIARHEVTVEQFKAFVDATGFKADAQALRGQPDHPVTFVSWPDALAYCRWVERVLKDSSHLPGRFQTLLAEGARVSLPSEAEWEKAAGYVGWVGDLAQPGLPDALTTWFGPPTAT